MKNYTQVNVFETGSEEAVYNAFRILSGGGVIIEPIHELPWSKCCAAIIDKYGLSKPLWACGRLFSCLYL